MLNQTLKHARRVVIGVVGFTLVTLGIVMLVTPGPGWAVIILGLSVLAVEFVWARRLLKRLKQAGSEVASSIFWRRKKRQNDELRGEGTRETGDGGPDGGQTGAMSGGSG